MYQLWRNTSQIHFLCIIDTITNETFSMRPLPFDLRARVVCVNELEVLESLRMTVLGTSSFLHTWDPVSETFLSSGAAKDLPIRLIIGGKDDTMSSRYAGDS
jgi:hypothetical protein